jgi:hypothetical protein
MTLPTPATVIKLLLVSGLAAAGGCAGGLAEAPFVARPGSVERGDLRGPFDGQVLDADSGKPLAGATVVGSWAFEGGAGLVGPADAAWRRVETDADGRYRVPEVEGWPRPARLARFTLLVYKRGWVAYRSDRRIEDASARGDFTQASNVVKLERFPSTMTHAAHLRYVGAGGPLLAELGPELHEASDERAEATAERAEAVPSEGGPPPDAAVLLSPDELKAVTGYQGSFTTDKLGDLPSSPQYDSVHWRAVDQPEKFDAALRLFHFPPAEAERQYVKLLGEYPSAEEKNEVGDRSLRAQEGDLLAVAALDRQRGALIVFTCGAGQCHDPDTVAAIVRRMWPRLERALAGRPPDAETPAPEKPAAETPERETPPAPEQRGPLRLKPPELP